MFCKHCGTPIPDDSIYCPNCGGKQIEQNSYSDNSSTSSYTPTNPQKYNTQQKPTEIQYYENDAGLGAFFFALVVPVIGIIMYFVTRKTTRHASYYLIGAFVNAFIINFIKTIMRG